jgi:hypothetical protein
MTTQLLLKGVAIAAAPITVGLLYLAVQQSRDQVAWSSHHVELTTIAGQCPGQHIAIRDALGDGRLGLFEARRLIEDCAVEALGRMTQGDA